jgi:hypothetical protein
MQKGGHCSVKTQRKLKRKSLTPPWPTSGPRALRAWAQCESLLHVLDRHAAEGACDLATLMLENAAAHLELLTDHPAFHLCRYPSMILPPTMPPPIYNRDVIRRAKTAQIPGRDVLKIPTPTVEELEALFNLPSDPPSATGGERLPS